MHPAAAVVPAFLVVLTDTCHAECAVRYIAGDGCSGSGEHALAQLQRSDQIGIAADEAVITDGGLALDIAVIIDHNRAAAEVDALADLGITESYIKTQGIGVMVIDTYGQGAIGSLPYDPTVYDNVNVEYSKDPSSSNEKEDKDCFTYSMARIGKLVTTDIADTETVAAKPLAVRAQGGKLCITADKAQTVNVTSAAGVTRTYRLTPGQNIIGGLGRGVYIVNGRKVAL